MLMIPLQMAERFPESVGVVVPTFEAERHWLTFEAALGRQGIPAAQVLVIDSGSTDRTCALARESGYRVIRIPQKDFGHGVTRQTACAYLGQSEFLLFLTQDVVLADDFSARTLCSALDDPSVGAAFGRQLPRGSADPIESHARYFNYPATSHVRTLESRQEVGIKAAFFSNSFAVYRRTALEAVGGFPADVILGEDTVVAARLLLNGWKVAYCADASAVHSHHLTWRQEFSRYFDTGVLHARQSWLLESFGDTGSEGLRFVRSELRFLWRHAPWSMPVALLRTALKFTAYRLGKVERQLPLRHKQKLSAHPNFWRESHSEASPSRLRPVPRQ